MFNLRDFLMIGFRDSIGKIADYQVILNATGWYEKNVLTTEDLAELQGLIEAKNTPPVVESVVEEPPMEETLEEVILQNDVVVPTDSNLVV